MRIRQERCHVGIGASTAGDVSRVYTGALMAALPPPPNVFIMARQYDTCRW